MANCLQQVQNLNNTGEIWNINRIFANTIINIFISSVSNQLFLLNIGQQETASFTLNLQSLSQPTNIGVTVNFFQLLENNVINIGSVIINELNTTFQIDFLPGDYVICISTNLFSYTGTFIGNFTQYQIYAILFPRAYTGEVSHSFEIEFHFERKKCDKPLQFIIINGSLPPGITFTSNAQLYGVLPNMDCIDDNRFLSPSQNWYSEHPVDFTWHPWGRQWRFQVRVWIIERPDIFIDEWFCIRVKNNWSWDRDNFTIPEDIITEEEQTINPIILPPDLCCLEPEEEPFVPEPIVPELCDCEKEDNDEQKVIKNFLQWYINTLENEDWKNNPHIVQFIEQFRESDYYRNLIIKSGLEHTLYTKEELEIKAFNEIIQQYEEQLIGGRKEDAVDYVMLELQFSENQKLFTTPLADAGEICLTELTAFDFLYADLDLEFIYGFYGETCLIDINTQETIDLQLIRFHVITEVNITVS